MLESTHVA